MATGVNVTTRVSNQRIMKPIVYGNTARVLPNKLANGHTHQWTLYLRSYNNEDITKFIRKVQFRLHESYTNQVRVIESPGPFEITETGWGEFEVQIKVYFIDVNEKPVTAFYYLRLFHPIVLMPDGSQIVVNDHYDEIVFNEPTHMMYRGLTLSPNAKPNKDSTQIEQDHRRIRQKLEMSNADILAEIEDLRESLRAANELIQQGQKQLSEPAESHTPDA